MSNVLDARAYAWCSLGPLSEEGTSIAEDHAQGAGVIMYKGTINLKGIFRPTSGTVVHLAYSDGQNWIARLPLRLRVLSCFSNPLTERTSVSVGCDLAYYENRKEPIKLDTRDENTSVPEAVWRAATPPLSASWLVGMILCILRIRYDGTIPLTNYYTKQDFDMSAGYVEELGKLCSSEGYVCRMNELGRAEFIKKDPPITTGALLTEADLIDFNPVNSGELPGDAIYSKYQSLRLKAPENDDPNDPNQRDKRNWEMEESTGQSETYYHDWTEYLPTPTGNWKKYRDSYGYELNASQYPGDYLEDGFRVGVGGVLEVPVYEVQGFPRREEIVYVPYSKTKSIYDEKDRVVSRHTLKSNQWGESSTYTTFIYADADGFSTGGIASGSVSVSRSWQAFVCNYVQDGNNTGPSLPPPGLSVRARGGSGDKEEDNGEVIEEGTVEFSPLGPVQMSLGEESSYAQIRNYGLFTSLRKIITYERNKASGITKTNTRNYVPYMNTTEGSEVLSRIRDRRNPWNAIGRLENIATELVEYGSEVRIRTEREFGIQRRPSQAERTTESNKKTPNVEQQENIAWAVGSAASQTAVELSPPYAPDDRIIGGGGSYVVIPSDAPQKVLAYARTENRYLFGHRNGNGIQILPEMLPPRPLKVFFIRLNGCTAAFLSNGRTWNIDPTGVTMTCDALFWGAVDGTVADVWFPMPPGAASLPAPIAISTNAYPVPANGISIPFGFDFANPDLNNLFSILPQDTTPAFAKEVTPNVLLKPYTETVSLYGGAGAGGVIGVQYWVPQLPENATQLVGGAGSGGVISSAANASGKSWASTSTFVPSQGQTSGQSVAGKVWTSTSVFVPAVAVTDYTIAGKNWSSSSVFNKAVGSSGLIVASGKSWTSSSVFSPATGSSSGSDPNFSTVSALFHFDGSNNSTSFPDSSSNNVVLTRVGSGVISTAQGKYGQSYLNGSGDRLVIPASGLFAFAGDFTVELWFYQTSRADYDTLLEIGFYNAGIMLRNGPINPGIWVNNNQFNYSFSTLNQWIHIAVVRSGSTVKPYVDGTSIGTATISGTVGSSTNGSFIGDSTHFSGRHFKGYVDEFRVSKFARYTADFTPSGPFPNQ